MQPLDTMAIAWILLAAFLLLGLILYERTGLRLGGVLVLPLLLIYAIFDLTIVAVFGVGAAAALIFGEVVHRYGLVYGRRLLYVFLFIGIAATLVARQYVGMAASGFVVGLLPGLFAYNLHREGRYLEGASSFALWFGILLAAAVAIVWVVTHPEETPLALAGASLIDLSGAVQDTATARVPGIDLTAVDSATILALVESVRSEVGAAE